MLEQSAADLVIRLAAVYALAGLFAGLTVLVLLSVIRLVQIPKLLRTALYAVYALTAVGLAAAWTAGALQPPAVAAGQVAAAAESAKAFDARNSAIVAADSGLTPVGQSGVVYIQVPDMDARFAAEDLWRSLKEAGFQSPGIELITGRSPSEPEVRYFNDADRPLAEQVAALAAKHGLKGSVVKTIANYKAPPGQMEFWYPR
ncbi:hypothetical protein GCM10008171_23620 [Methylopila jiangsuensis]|uniref:Uncharacterized protein n=1 Tax=Methylopila jiangsuensis TaxID=586230 RepID=A0A9W6JKB8_9HYPH|nr:hypothetical protein [Methylopila jiangsuensis]MDR6286552.1 hypothetical protein [Methylopila jiangsuensis]GLK77108.1 hypothetical protein GCM10008171_23620 [Methylopila jiangsuensis]